MNLYAEERGNSDGGERVAKKGLLLEICVCVGVQVAPIRKLLRFCCCKYLCLFIAEVDYYLEEIVCLICCFNCVGGD